VLQYYCEIPTQYRLLYLLSFLYAHQHEKVIVFVSNCEMANHLVSLCEQLDFNLVGRRKDDIEPLEKTQMLFKGNICKLHGDMEHEKRKTNFLKFDKACEEGVGTLLICTDVASRGLDFKKVNWVLQHDLSSNIKEYVNRIGRTARIATQGNALCFVMPEELEYVKHIEQKYKITLMEKSRYRLFKDFEELFNRNNPSMKYKFRKLVNIEDKDEQQESLHAMRETLTNFMLNEATGLKQSAQTARSSSTRAYAGHAAEMRHVFDLKKLNLTEYARSFGLYK